MAFSSVARASLRYRIARALLMARFMPGGPIRFQRPARLWSPRPEHSPAAFLECLSREMSSGSPGPKSIGIQTAQPRCFQPIRGRRKLWSL